MTTDRSGRLEEFIQACLGWAKIIEIENILAAHWRVAQGSTPYTKIAALVDIEDFTREYRGINRDQEIVAAVLEIAVQIGYREQAAYEPKPEAMTKQEGIKVHIRDMLQDLYRDLNAAVETGVYEEVKLHADSLLGIADLTLRPDPDFHDLLEEAVEKTERAYKTYVQIAERKERKARQEGYLELADQYLENIGIADEQAFTLSRILRHLQCKKAKSE